MQIRRNAQEYGLPERIIEIKLTDKELEQAYRIREEQYQIEDIKNAIQEEYEAGVITEDMYQKSKDDMSLIKAVLGQYNRLCSCNIAYNVTMEEAIKRVIGRAY